MKHEVVKFKDGNQITLPQAESYRDCMLLIQSDIYRLCGSKVSVMNVVKKMLNPLRNNVLIWFRFCQYRRGLLYYPCSFVYRLYCRAYNIDLPATTKVGYGFYIGHGMCIVINGRTIIGNNVNVSQFLNIGTNNTTPAKIGDNVYLGPHVSVVEDVEIGHAATIGAGAVVTKDIPANATAVGVPAKVLNYDKPGVFVNRRWRLS